MPSSHLTLCRPLLPLTRWTFVGKVMSLLFNMLSRLVPLHKSMLKEIWVNLYNLLAGSCPKEPSAMKRPSPLFWFSCSVVSDSETPRTTAARSPCPSLSSRVCSDSCPLSQWCQGTTCLILCPLLSSCLQSFPASGAFPVGQFFALGLIRPHPIR